MPEDIVATRVAPDQGFTFTLGGILSKTAETALEIARNKAESGNNQAVGTAYPTGQTNPERVTADEPAPSATERAQRVANYLPYIVGGGVIVSIVLAVLAVRKR